MMPNALQLFYLISATWRLASLVCNETGPFAIFEHNRQFFRRLHKRHAWFRATHLYEGVRCEWCVSIWIGLFLITPAWLLAPEVTILFTLPFTLSAWAVVMKFIVQTLSAIKEYYEASGKMFKFEADTDNARRIEELEEAVEQAANALVIAQEFSYADRARRVLKDE